MIHPYLTHFLALKHTGVLDRPLAEWAAIRSSAIYAFSYSIPSTEVLIEISKLGPVVEMGAGSGYWGWMLSQLATVIECFDSESYQQAPKWFEVKRGDPTELKRFGESALLLVWPPEESEFSEKCLDHYGGKDVVYVGNLFDPNARSQTLPKTGTQNFHRRLQKDFRLVKTVTLPYWPGFQDQAYFFNRE